MALTYTTTVNKTRMVHKLPGGLKVATVQLTIGAITDYTVGTGFPLQTDANKFGFRKVFNAFGFTLQTSANVEKPVQISFNPLLGTVKIFEAATVAQDEIEQADLATNDILMFTVIGV
jgi:hypothetical protein